MGRAIDSFDPVVISSSPTALYAAIRGLLRVSEAFPSGSLFTSWPVVQSLHGCSEVTVAGDQTGGVGFLTQNVYRELGRLALSHPGPRRGTPVYVSFFCSF